MYAYSAVPVPGRISGIALCKYADGARCSFRSADSGRPALAAPPVRSAAAAPAGRAVRSPPATSATAPVVVLDDDEEDDDDLVVLPGAFAGVNFSDGPYQHVA